MLFDVEQIIYKRSDDEGAEEEIWYKAKDVLAKLQFSATNVTNNLDVIDDENKKLYFDGDINTPYWIISRYAFGQLILKSKSEYAQNIKDRLCKEYIPYLFDS